MRWSLRLPTDRVDLGDEFVSAHAIAEIARAAESAGFDAVYVTDHPMPDDEWLRTGGHQALDPLIALTCVAMATQHLHLMTHIYVMPYRNPFLTAKGVATLDLLSGGRVLFGLGAGYLKAEFDALGVSFEERNAITDEAIRAVKAAWSGDSVRLQGSTFNAVGHTVLPLPVQRPHPPIWVGGNSRIAIRRAVELGDGWMPNPTAARFVARRRTSALESIDDLKSGIRYAAEHGQSIGRVTPISVCSAPFNRAEFGTPKWSPGEMLEEVHAQAEIGVDWLAMRMNANTRREYLKAIEQFGRDILSAGP